MHKRAMAVLAGVAMLSLGSCQKAANWRERTPPAQTFTLLADSELQDVESAFKDDIRRATGLNLTFTYSGTLDAIDQIAAGENFDALWVSNGKYLALNHALSGRIIDQEKTMLSPVVLGLKPSKAHALGWDTKQPTWNDIAAAAKAGKFTFGMTNPASDDTGLSALLGLAASLARTSDALTEADVKNPRLADFFDCQSLTSGSAGWLAEAYQRDQSKVDGIIDYESVLLSLNAGGKLSEPLTLVYPAEGIITAEYPLMLLNAAKRTQYDKLVGYLRSADFQTRMSARTLRRPVNPDAAEAPSIPKRTLIELPFPGQASLITTLLDNFVAARPPSDSRYVLDLSGSMQGARIHQLKDAMLMLASNASLGSRRYVQFHSREEVGIITFSSQPARTVLFLMGTTAAQNSEARTAITRVVNRMAAEGDTAIYSSVQQALLELEQERSRDKEKRYYTVVLMTDGQNNNGLSEAEFVDWYRRQGEGVRGIPVFAILFGEGNPAELQALADLTGGRVFDARAGNASPSNGLIAVFKEIRGYQ